MYQFFSIFENEHYAADQLYVFLWVQFQQIGKFGCARDKVLVYKKITKKVWTEIVFAHFRETVKFSEAQSQLKKQH